MKTRASSSTSIPPPHLFPPEGGEHLRRGPGYVALHAAVRQSGVCSTQTSARPPCPACRQTPPSRSSSSTRIRFGARSLMPGLAEAGFDNVTCSTNTTRSARPDLSHRSRHHPDRPRESKPRRAGADVPGLARRAAADRHVRRSGRQGHDRGRHRRRRERLHRRRTEEGARAADRRHDDLALSASSTGCAPSSRRPRAR